MRNRLTFYPFLRRQFDSLDEVAGVINRSHRYVQDRFNGKREFTHNERLLIVNYLGTTTEETEHLFVREVTK